MTVFAPTRIAIKEILMATDYSSASESALPFALEMARHFDAGLHLVHVLLPGEWEPTADDTTGAFEYKPAEQAEKHMASLLSTIDLGTVRCEYLIRRGSSVWEELDRIIQDKAIDMVVLGTHGRGGIEKLLVGSVAEEVFRKAPCPVLTIGPGFTGGVPTAFRRIVFATDLTPESLEHLPFVLGFAEDWNAHVIVMHVPKSPYVPDRLVAESTVKRMRELIPPQANLEYAVEFGDPAYAIKHLAENENCDLIMLGAHIGGDASTHFSGTIAHKILLEARCPVLTVHWYKRD